MMSQDQGTCFGFRIRSPIQFLCLRGGEGHQLEVAAPDDRAPSGPLELAVEWTEPGGRQAYARLYRDRSAYWLWTRSGRWTLVEPEVPRITLPTFEEPALTEEQVWNIPVALCLLHRRDLALHALAVEAKGRALLLVAPGGAGKSTLGAAFAQAGYRVLSEDVSCLRMDPLPAVIPGPAMMRLRPDVIPHVSVPGARVVRETPARVTIALDPHGRGTCDPVPLRAIFLLEASSDGFARERIPPGERIRRLWSMTFRVPVDDWLAYCFSQLAELAHTIPTWSFRRPLRFEDLSRTIEYLTG